METARAYSDDLRERAKRYGRSADDITIVTALTPVVGETEEEAQQKYEELKAHVSYDGALALVGGWTDIDFAELDPDQPVEHVESDAIQGFVDGFTKADPDREWTVREVAEFVGFGGIGFPVVGTPESIADELERWVDEGGVDGFNICEAVRPGTLVDFVEHVVPVLQDRGLHREEYTGETLRENIFGEGSARLPPDHPGREIAQRGKVAPSPRGA